MRNKVALIVPYFGKLPNYFPFFINSFSEQPITLFVVSDCFYDYRLPDNCQWISLSFVNFVALVELKLGVKTNMVKAYKICDFKPMFGEIFADYLVDFDFWGNIDPDTIMGNFTHFIDDELLNKIDFYSGIKEYVSGSMFLIRNQFEFNRLWQKSKSKDEVCNTNEYLGFDECGGRYYTELTLGKSIFECNTPIQSFTEIIKLEEENGLRTCFRNTILEPRGFEPVQFIEQGIFYRDKPYMLLHFLYFKTKFYFTVPLSYISYQYINSFGFFNYHPQSVRFLFSSHPFNWVKKKVGIQIKKLLKN